MKTFYSHLIEYETVLMDLEELDLTEKQRIHITSLIDSHLHHTILDAILSELTDDDKIVFAKLIHQGDHGKIWQHLNSKVDKIEDLIKSVAENVKLELKRDIKEAKEKK